MKVDEPSISEQLPWYRQSFEQLAEPFVLSRLITVSCVAEYTVRLLTMSSSGPGDRCTTFLWYRHIPMGPKLPRYTMGWKVGQRREMATNMAEDRREVARNHLCRKYWSYCDIPSVR